MRKISVFMPCYNHAEFVGQAIESVLNQTNRNFEFVVLENGSTDNSREVIMKYQDQIDKIIIQDKNNVFVEDLIAENCTGEYISFMCADDYWCPEKMEKQIAAMDKMNVQTCFTWGINTDVELKKLSGDFGDVFMVENRSRFEWLLKFWDEMNCLSFPSAIMKREKYLKYAKKANRFRQLGDWYFWLNILLEEEIYVVPEVLVKMRRTGKNESGTRVDNVIRLGNESAYIIKEIFEKMDDETFVNTFKDRLINKNARTKVELACEKIMIMIERAKKGIIYQQVGIQYFYEHCYEDGVKEMLESRYNYSYHDFLKFNGESGISMWHGAYSHKCREVELLEKQRLLILKQVKDQLFSQEMISISKNIIVCYQKMIPLISSLKDKTDYLDIISQTMKDLAEPIIIVSKYFEPYGCKPKESECDRLVDQLDDLESEEEKIQMIQNVWKAYTDVYQYINELLGE